MFKQSFIVACGAAALAAMGLGTPAGAQLLVYEGFEYTADETLIGSGGGFGFDVPWTNDFGPGSEAPNIIATADSLADPNALVPGKGGSASLQGDGGNVRIFRTLDTASPAIAPFLQGGEIAADGTTIYLGVIVKHGGGGDFMDDLPDLTKTNTLEVGTGNLGTSANAAFVVGIDAAGGSPQTRAITEKADQTNFVDIGATSITPDLVVMKIDFADGDDTMSVYVNPTSDTTLPVTPTGTLTGDFGFNRIGLAAFQGSPAGEYDEFRLAGSYADIFTIVPDFTLLGDADGDFDVDLDDYVAIRDNFFSQIILGSDGDVSGDPLNPGASNGFNGVVDLEDYVIWKGAFESINGLGSAPSLGVPEPTSFALFALSGLGCLCGRSRRRAG